MRRNDNLKLPFFAVLAVAFSAGCAAHTTDEADASSSEETIELGDDLTKGSIALPPPPAGVSMTTLSQGNGWSKVSISGTSTDLATGQPITVTNEEVLVVRGLDGLAAAPISGPLKSKIHTSELAAIAAKQQQSSENAASGATSNQVFGGATTGMIGGTASTVDQNTPPGIPVAPVSAENSEGETLLFLHKETLDQMEAALAAPPPTKVKMKSIGGSFGVTSLPSESDGGPEMEKDSVQYGGCHDEDWQWSKGWNPSNSIDRQQGSESGSFSGNLHFQAGYELFADAIVRLRKKRTSVAGYCFTYGFSFRNVELGSLLVANASLKAHGEFHKAWKPSWQIAKPKLFEHLFFVGPVPVIIGMNMPVTAGVEVDAQAELDLEIGVDGWGAATVICTTNGCQKYTASYLDVDDLTSPGVTLSGKARVKPWVQVAGRAYLYGDSIMYAQAGVKPFAEANLWAHAGQSCGDANQDGTDDYVSALTLSLDVGADITAEVNLFDVIDEDWSWEVWRKPVGFWSFGPGTAADPMAWVTDPAPQQWGDWEVCGDWGDCGGYEKILSFRMRPCWPYTSPITYEVDWGGGSKTHHTAAPSQAVVLSPTYQTAGTKTVVITAKHDAVGREIGESTTLTFQVGSTGGGGITLPSLPGGGTIFAP